MLPLLNNTQSIQSNKWFYSTCMQHHHDMCKKNHHVTAQIDCN